MNASQDPIVHLEAARAEGAIGPDTLPARLTFVNDGPSAARILDRFEPIPVFFSFDLIKADGTPILLPGGGKTDLGRNGERYFELAAGEARSLVVDIWPLLTTALQPGAYSLRATYHNQYGRDCFRGTLTSNVVAIEVAAKVASRRGAAR